MNHQKALNKRQQAAGIVWHACEGCAQDWPFPRGVPPEVNEVLHENREWRCHTCVQQDWARGQRALAPLLRRYLDNHCQAADQEGMSALCECKACLDTRKALA